MDYYFWKGYRENLHSNNFPNTSEFNYGFIIKLGYTYFFLSCEIKRCNLS